MIVVLVVAVALAVTLLLVARRIARTGPFLIDSTRGSAVFAMVGTAFAVLLAFVVLVAFQSYSRAKAGAESEAVAVTELFRTSAFFPPAQRDALQAQTVCYARAAVSEWTAMRDGRRSTAVDLWAARLREASGRLELRTVREQAAFRQLLEQRDQRIEGRRERLSEADPVVTAPVWLVLLLGGGVTVLLVLIFTDPRENPLVQAAAMAAVATMVVSGLLLVWYLDQPYEDITGSIKPVEMERSIAIMKSERRDLAEPCTPSGRAR
jgi:hypothetical protein